MAEVLASQKIMLQRRGKDTSRDDQEMSQIFAKHLDDIMTWLDAQPHMDVLYVHYSHVIQQPLTSAETVKDFVGQPLDVRKMAAVVDVALYRNRALRD
jgi:hypothetical protein